MDKDLDDEPCGNCLTTSRVDFYCRDCSKAICVACKTSHSGYPIKKLHDIVARTTTIQDMPALDGIHCKFHKYEVYQAICLTCDTLVCQKCVGRQHRNHQFAPIDDVIRDRKFALEQDIKTMKRLRLPQLNRVLVAAEQRAGEFDRINQQLKQQLATQADKLKREIDSIQEELAEMIDKRGKKDKENLRRERKLIENQISETRALVQTCEEEFNGARRTIPELFDFIRVSNEKVLELQKDIQPIFPVKSNFTPGSIFRFRLNDMFGKLEIKKEKDEVFRQLGMDKNQVIASDMDDTILSSFETKSKYIVSYLCPVNGKEAWMRTSSSHITLMKMNGVEVRNLKVDLNIEDLTMSKSGDFYATSLTSGHLNHVLKISPRGKVVVFANTFPQIPYGLFITRESDLLVCLHRKGDSQVVRMSQSGRIVQKMKYHADGVEQLFVKPYRVAQNGNGDIAVIDVGPRRVVVLDKFGSFRFNYDGSSTKIKNAFSPRSVARDKYNNYVVADYDNNAIHVFDKDGKPVHLILSKEIENPITVRVTNEGRMWVSQNGTKVHVMKYLAEK